MRCIELVEDANYGVFGQALFRLIMFIVISMFMDYTPKPVKLKRLI